METAIEVYQKPHTAMEIRAQVNLIQEVMQAVMKKDTHYGTIPGCAKPSLYKPGSEKLLSTFHIAIEPIVEDLSTEDVARYRVITRATSVNGQFLGSGVGEASSEEEKYRWREVVCSGEWDATPEDRKRLKWKKGRGDNSKPYSVMQIRTEKADVANTVLKMAKKRSQIDVTLTVTAASDIFTQDIEDIPEELQQAAINGDATDTHMPLPTELKRKEHPSSPPPPPAQAAAQAAPTPPPAPRSEPPRQTAAPARPPIQSPKPPAVRMASEAQGRRFYGIWMSSGRSVQEMKEFLREAIGTEDTRQIPLSRYEEICKAAEGTF